MHVHCFEMPEGIRLSVNPALFDSGIGTPKYRQIVKLNCIKSKHIALPKARAYNPITSRPFPVISILNYWELQKGFVPRYANRCYLSRRALFMFQCFSCKQDYCLHHPSLLISFPFHFFVRAQDSYFFEDVEKASAGFQSRFDSYQTDYKQRPARNKK